MSITEVPRAVARTSIDAWLRLTRLPLTVAERSPVGREHDDDWPPAALFESFASGVKLVGGSVLRDEELVDEGRRGRARVAQLRHADELEAVAEQRREESDEEFAARRQQAERRRKQAGQRSSKEKQRVERARKQEEQRVADRARRKKEEAERLEERAEEAAARTKRNRRSGTLAQEERALDEQKAALDAEQEVIDIGKQLDAEKARRSAS